MEGHKSVILLGDGRMAQDSLHILESHPGIVVNAVIHHRSPAGGFRRLRPVDIKGPEKLIACDNVNEPGVLASVDAMQPDLIFSVNNFDIIREPLLSMPADGILNFHNGPLPAYRGVNIPSWVIINGETQHAVTWHFVAAGLDSGAIVREQWFEVSEHETAISLTFKCIDEGLRVLPDILDDYVSGSLTARMPEGEGRYYSAKDAPNGGEINFSLTWKEIDRFVRGLTFHPFPNRFVEPHIRTPAGPVSVGRVTLIDGQPDNPPRQVGQVAAVVDAGLHIRCKDSLIALEYLSDADGHFLDGQQMREDFGLEAGMRL